MSTSSENAAHSDIQVLSTLNTDGSRRWLRPKLSRGKFLTARRSVAVLLILVFSVTPILRFRGKPLILLDLPHREFTFFGTTFLPTDTLLLAFLFLSIFISIFLVTALFGRIWCGWACPQTVYMEFLYRPIERFFEGSHYRSGGKYPTHPLRRVGMVLTCFLVSLFLSNTFLAYFVGWEKLIRWIVASPFLHPVGFAIVMAVTGLMMLDFCFLREQVCTLMCPYGRFQSVLLDPQSLIVSYDSARGEPRGRMQRRSRIDAQGPPGRRGDCIDCHLCVATCPTGIDIRDGLQMECIACTQCIDACNAVMDKIKKPLGLIRFSSQQAMETGQRSFFRLRIVVYPLVLMLFAGLFSVTLANRKSADVTFLRNRSAPYVVLASGDISATLLMKITNRTREPRVYEVGILEESRMESTDLPIKIEAGQAGSITLHVIIPPSALTRGRAEVTIRVTGDDGFHHDTQQTILGPLFVGGGPGTAGAEPSSGHPSGSLDR